VFVSLDQSLKQVVIEADTDDYGWLIVNMDNFGDSDPSTPSLMLHTLLFCTLFWLP
jgi:hypothetical protein